LDPNGVVRVFLVAKQRLCEKWLCWMVRTGRMMKRQVRCFASYSALAIHWILFAQAVDGSQSGINNQNLW
jgi:hypothetical protein